jgi:PRTRC genetic system protein A
MLNPKDALLMNHFPTLMVPQFQSLWPCPVNQTRLLMGKCGLYIETNRVWGRLVENLWCSPRALPYGHVEECDEFRGLLAHPDVMRMFAGEIREEAARYADCSLEWAGWVVWSESEGFRYQPLDIEEVSGESVKFGRYRLAGGEHLVFDIHSHGTLTPFFSRTDDRDDAGGVKISVVLGSYDAQARKFNYRIRYCVEGIFIERPEINRKEGIDS